MKYLNNFAMFESRICIKELIDILEVEYEREDFMVSINIGNVIPGVSVMQTYSDDSEIGKLINEANKIDMISAGMNMVSTPKSRRDLVTRIHDKVLDINKPIIDRINEKYGLRTYIDTIYTEIHGDVAIRVDIGTDYYDQYFTHSFRKRIFNKK